MQRPMTPSWYSTWPPESNLILKIADSMSNESPNSVLQDAHAYYRNQSPNRWRISVCSSIQAAAVLSWTSKGATPGKASCGLFESVKNGWYLKRKPQPSPSIFMYTPLPFNWHVIVQQGSEGPNRRPRMHTLESPMSHARSSYERKLVQILKWVYQKKALFIIFTISAYICDSFDQIVEKNGPPAQNCRPLG